MNLPELLQHFENTRKSGNGYHASCPMPDHNDSTPSVSVTQDIDTGKIMLYCWGCDTKAPELVQALGLRLSDLFGDPGHPGAVKMIAAQSVIPEEEVEKLADYTVYTRDRINAAEEYLQKRFNLTADEGYRLSLGLDPGDHTIPRPQSCRAFNSGTPHLIIPFKDPDGNLVGMQGRRLVPGDPRWRSVSGPGWSQIGCFNWNAAGPIIITEGPSDALSVVGRAKLPALAIRGASLTNEATLNKIKEWIGDREAIVIGDSGSAGEKFAETISKGLGISQWIPPEEYGDLCDYLAANGSLDHLFGEASVPEPVSTPIERREELQRKIRNTWPYVIDDPELIAELAEFRSEERSHYDMIFIDLRNDRNLCRTLRDFDGLHRVIEAAVDRATPPPAGGGVGNGGGGGNGPVPPNIPLIVWDVQDQLHTTEDQVRDAINQYTPGSYYQAARGEYVKVIVEDLQPLDDAGVKSMLSHMAHWQVVQGQRQLGHPPADAVRMVRSHSWDCDLPMIKRRVEVPFMLENGDIVSAPGFHNESGIYLLPREQILVPEVPMTVTDQNVARAVSILEDVIEGFNFKNNASKTNLMAMTLTSPLRELFKASPMVPLLTSTAPQSGSGKGTSIRVPLSTAGVGPYSLSTTAYNVDENEFEKKLVAKLLKKSTYIFLDNIRAQVNSAVLEQMLTAANYDGRTLGHSEVNSLSTLVLWVCTLQSTGSFNRDLTRRCVPVELRKNYKGEWQHKNIDAYLAERRGALIWACFVIARRWIEMGKPISQARFDGYGGWTETIGGMLEHVLGYEDFLDNLASFRKTQDEISMTVDGILERWLGIYGEDAHPARMAIEDTEDPMLHQLLNLRGNPTSRQVLNALERHLTGQQGYIVNNTHVWECVGLVPYKKEGVKKLFRCVPLED